MLCTIITLMLLMLFALRASYVNIICNDWNIKLDIYIEYYVETNDLTKTDVCLELKRMNDKLLIPLYYWFSLNKWTAKSMVNDSVLFELVNDHISKINENNKILYK